MTDTTRKVDIHKAGPAVVTYPVMSAATENDWLRIFIRDCLERFLRADWGDTGEDDSQLNNEALAAADGSRLMGSYSLPRLIDGEDKLWIIADAYGGPAEMEPHITILFPSDY